MYPSKNTQGILDKISTYKYLQEVKGKKQSKELSVDKTLNCK